MSRRAILRIGVFVFWALMAVWLIRFEAFPERFARATGGYRRLFSEDVLIADAWMRIDLKGTPIGYSHTTMEVNEDDPALRHVIENELSVRLNLMGRDQQVHVDTTALLNERYELQQFRFELLSPATRLRVKAERTSGRQFDVVLDTGATIQKTVVAIPDDAVIYSPMTEMAMRRLEPGQDMTIKVFDPTTMKTSLLKVEALRRTTVDLDDESHEATVLSIDYNGAKVLSWVAADGTLLRQETPFGWTLEQCDMEEAFAAFASSEQSAELLSEMAVPSAPPIRRPRQARSLLLKLTGVDFGPDELASHRQQVREHNGNELLLHVKADPEFPTRSDATLPDDVRPFLAPTLHVQAGHAEIKTRAGQLTEGLDHPAAKAKAIFHWVYEEVNKEMTVSLPSALDVLKTMRGDCNEHTVLFVALARAAGLPARVTVGIAYHEGGFYYHAWPSVYIGRWHECDPTWGQEGVDAAHVALAQGELAEQLSIVKVMGQLRIEVLEEGSASSNGEQPL